MISHQTQSKLVINFRFFSQFSIRLQLHFHSNHHLTEKATAMTMAALRSLPSFAMSTSLSQILPRTILMASQTHSQLSSILHKPVMFSFSLWIPGLLSDIWGSVLRAVPKQKTSHMKKRHRQMAGKALKDVQNLKTCPGCGNIKRTHVLCSHCVAGMCLLPLLFIQ